MILARKHLAILAIIAACDRAHAPIATAAPTDAKPIALEPSSPPVATAQPLPSRPIRLTLAVGDRHTCALVRKGDDPRGRVKCWGDNEDGQLGLGDRKTRGDTKKQMGDALPFVALPQSVDIVAIDAENRRSCALDSEGKLWCWGSNESGELGLGDTRNRGITREDMASLVPVDLPGKVESFSLGGSHACALLEGGAVHCWGSKGPEIGLGEAQLRGDEPGEMGSALPRISLGDNLRAVHVAAGMAHTCVLFGHAKIKCFGEGRYGVIGTADTRSRGEDARDMGDALPFVDLGSFRAALLVTGGLHACARSTEHRVKCWGNNHSGQLGLGHTDGPGGKPGQSRVAPPGGDARPSVDLGNDGSVLLLATDNTSTCALLDRGRAPDGSLQHAITCWPARSGERFAQLDPGPDLVPMAIAPGGAHGCALVVERALTIDARPSSGRVKCWGDWVPGEGVVNAGTGMPERDRTETLEPSTPLVDLGADVRVVIPDA
jgi:hypothetical protein